LGSPFEPCTHKVTARILPSHLPVEAGHFLDHQGASVAGSEQAAVAMRADSIEVLRVEQSEASGVANSRSWDLVNFVKPGTVDPLRFRDSTTVRHRDAELDFGIVEGDQQRHWEESQIGRVGFGAVEGDVVGTAVDSVLEKAASD
jgi:hypothetical protein